MHTLLVLFFYFLCQMNADLGQIRLKYGGPPLSPLVCRTLLQTPRLVLLHIEFHGDLNKNRERERENCADNAAA